MDRELYVLLTSVKEVQKRFEIYSGEESLDNPLYILGTTYIHAARDCKPGDNCSLKFCAELKKHYLSHAFKCKNSRTCVLCAELCAFCMPHAETCTAAHNSCAVPYCDRLRIFFRRKRLVQSFGSKNHKRFRHEFTINVDPDQLRQKKK